MVPALAVLIAVAWLQYGLVSVTFQGIPADVTDIRLYEWREDAPPVPITASIDRRGPNVVIAAPRRAAVVTVFSRNAGDYLVDGPASWTASASTALTDHAWRRSVRGLMPAGVQATRVEWMRADDNPGPWPRCFRAAASWECWGIGGSDAGVVAVSAGGRVWWATASPLGAGGWRPAAWGRLIRIRDSYPEPSEVRMTFAHPVTPSSARFAGIRLETGLVADAGAAVIGPGIAWVFGEAVPPKAWMEVRSAVGGPSYVPLDEVASGGLAVPLEIRLPDSRTIRGTAAGVGGEPASSALITLFRLIDPPPPPGSTVKPRRVFAAEEIANENGEFTIAGRGEAQYEIVAWHSQFGRASVVLDESRDSVQIKLGAAGLVRGRVVSAGRPLAGVDIVSVPDAETMTQSRDVTDVKGGDAKTGQDGRFVVALAPAGGGELRIGGGVFAIRRMPLPRSITSGVELGDVELEQPIELFVAIEGDPGCTLQMVGPLGKMGLQIVQGVRDPRGHRISVPETGLWQAGLVCSGGRRSLTPDSIPVTRALAGTVVTLAVR